MAYYTHFHILATDVNRVFGNVLEARALFLRAGATAQANECALIYARTNADFERIEREVATLATEAIRRKITQTAKRPDSGGVSGDLKGHVVCDRLPAPGPSIAGVGVGRIEELDKAVNPLRPGAGPYWRAQEYGWAGLVGHVMKGYFYNAGFSGPRSAPNPAEFRVHPLFRAGGKGPRMTVRRPIQARHYLRDGAREAEMAWRLRVRAAEQRLVSAMNPLIAGGRAAVTPAQRRAARQQQRTPPPRRLPRRPPLP